MYERDYDVDYVVMRFRLPGGPERERVLIVSSCLGKRCYHESENGIGLLLPFAGCYSKSIRIEDYS